MLSRKPSVPTAGLTMRHPRCPSLYITFRGLSPHQRGRRAAVSLWGDAHDTLAHTLVGPGPVSTRERPLQMLRAPVRRGVWLKGQAHPGWRTSPVLRSPSVLKKPVGRTAAPPGLWLSWRAQALCVKCQGPLAGAGSGGPWECPGTAFKESLSTASLPG